MFVALNILDGCEREISRLKRDVRELIDGYRETSRYIYIRRMIYIAYMRYVRE